MREFLGPVARLEPRYPAHRTSSSSGWSSQPLGLEAAASGAGCARAVAALRSLRATANRVLADEVAHGMWSVPGCFLLAVTKFVVFSPNTDK